MKEEKNERNGAIKAAKKWRIGRIFAVREEISADLVRNGWGK